MVAANALRDTKYLFAIVSYLFGTGCVFAQLDDPARLGLRPNHKSISKPKVIWQWVSESGGLSNPTVNGDSVYFGDDHGVLRALRSTDGHRLWEFNHRHRIYSTPACDGERVYCTTRAAAFAVSCKNGERVWERQSDAYPGDCVVWPAKVEGPRKTVTLFYSESDGQTFAVTGRTGQQVWQSKHLDPTLVDPPGFDGDQARFDNQLTRPRGISTDGRIVVQSIFDQSRVVVFSRTTGNLLWAYQTQGWVSPAAAIGERDVLFGSQDKHIHCLDKTTGEPIWNFESGSRFSSSPSVTEQRVFIPSCDGNLYCLDRESGDLLWSFKIPFEGSTAIYSKPLITNDRVHFAAAEGHVYSLNRETGRLIWSIEPAPDSDLYSSLTTDGHRLFVMSRNAGEKGINSITAIGEADVSTSD